MRSRRITWVAAVMTLVVAVSGVFAYRSVQQNRRDEAIDAAAVAVAGVLTSGETSSGAIRGAPDVKALLAETSDVKHAVALVRTDKDGERPTATLRHSWTLQEGAPAYTYEVTVPLTERDGRWAADWQPAYLAPGFADGDTLRTTRRPARRADVLGQGDVPLVTSRPVVNVGIDRAQVSKDVAVASAAQLAKALALDEQPYALAVGGAGEKAFVRAVTVRDPSPELTMAKGLRLPGLLLQPDELPLAPTAGFARPILGTVGEATAEIVGKSGGRVQPGDVVGLSGLLASYDETLAGRPGQVLQIVPSSGAPRELAAVPAKAGTPVRTSIDARVQALAESTLAGTASPSALVAIRPSDGQVLAAASGPAGKGASTATLGEYAPGSTFKAVTALALLRAGLTPQSPVDCPATTTVDGRTFKNYTGYPEAKLGKVTLRTAFAQSCNTALIAARGTPAPGALPEAAASLGLGGDPALGVPASLGAVPAPQGETERAASMIGQGRVQATPLGMAAVAASIGAGRTVAPTLVLSPEQRRPAAPAKPVTPEEAGALRELMRAVVTEGNSAFLAGTPGGDVAAKSGTAEYGDATPPKTHAWMIALQGDLAVAVFVEEGTGGAADAGPLVKSFLTKLAS